MSRKPISKTTTACAKEPSFGDALIEGLTEALALKRRELALENAMDGRAIKAQLQREKSLGVQIARADYLSGALVDRLLAGESAIRIWREHRGMTLTALATKVGISPSYLSRIENGSKAVGRSHHHAQDQREMSDARERSAARSGSAAPAHGVVRTIPHRGGKRQRSWGCSFDGMFFGNPLSLYERGSI